MMTTQFKPTTMPNFITVYVGNMQKEVQVSVADLTESEAKEFAQVWGAAFLEHWTKKVKLSEAISK